ncbi:MAG: TonB family protein [Salinivirgaceae bacterium]|nr:TonB family protein [Salinivirgaceae bacterium]
MITTKEQRIATVGTAVFCVLLLLMLVLVRFINDPTDEEEGVLVNFGDTEQGMGEVEPRPAVAQTIPTPPPTPTPPEPTPTQTGEEEVVNQDFEESAVIEQKKRAEQKKRQEELQRQQELERQRIAEEQRRQEEERKRQEEQQRQQQQQQEINSRAASAFAGRNVNGGNTGEGNTGQPGNQGSLNGDINSNNRVGNGGGNGINFNLAGRSFGSTPPKPEYNSKSEGKVVVEIRVDRSGTVVSASPGKAGTTTNDPVLREAAKAAALKAKFNSDPNAAEIQVGTITYTFIQE